MARSTITHETVKTQDLTGSRFELKQKKLAKDMSRQLAKKMTDRTGDPWEGFVQEYTPTVRK